MNGSLWRRGLLAVPTFCLSSRNKVGSQALKSSGSRVAVTLPLAPARIDPAAA